MQDVAARDAANPTAFRLQEAYRWTREVVADLTEGQLRWQPNPTAPAIRFHLFHIARWADVLHQMITEAEAQVWHAEGIAARWGLDPAALGFGESGALIEDGVAMALPFPDRSALFAYCDRVIAAADRVLADIDDDAMAREMTYGGRTSALGVLLADQLSHTARHLGMIECLRGVQGLRGTASV